MPKKVAKKKWDNKKIKWFKETSEKWIKHYHLTDWVVIYEWSEISSKDNEQGSTTLATCTPDSVYHEAKIIFYPEILNSSKESWSGDYVENKIKHELCHMLTI